MAQVVAKKQLLGLDTYSNPLVVEYGKTLIAENCSIDRPGALGNRKGFNYFSTPTAEVLAMMQYQNGMIVSYSDGTLAYDAGLTGVLTPYPGTYFNVANNTMRGVSANGNFYFTTSNGPYKISNITSTPVKAGVPPGLDIRGTLTGTGGGFLNGNTQTAYSMLWQRTDNQNNALPGATSQPIFIVNANQFPVTSATYATGVITITTTSPHGFTTGDLVTIAGASPAPYDVTNQAITVTGSSTFTYTTTSTPTTPATGTITASKSLNVALTFSVPADVIAGDVYQIYRTQQSTGQAALPILNFNLVFSAPYTTGSTISYTDTSSDILVSANTEMYTNSDQGGILQSNYRPPLCTDIGFYAGSAIFSNTATSHQILVTNISVVGMVADTSYIEFATTDGTKTVTYTASSAESPSTNKFQLFSTGSPEPNVHNTMISLVRIINTDTTGYWYAEYLSGASGIAGQLRLYARDYITGGFYLLADSTATGNDFTPVIPTTGTANASSNDARPNRAYASLKGSADLVPINGGYASDAGARDKRMERNIGSRDALYFPKEDGIYYLQGTEAPFGDAIPLNTTCKCLAPDSVQAISDRIIMLSNQGFVQFNSSGFIPIGVDITRDIEELYNFSNLRSIAFAVPFETSNIYICWVPTLESDTVATKAYVFHIKADQWVTWTKPATAGLVMDINNTLYIGSGLENSILYQRNGGGQSDYSDETVPVTITAVAGQTINFSYTSAAAPMDVGFSISQGEAFAKATFAVLTSPGNYQITIDRDATFATGDATVNVPIYSNILFPPDPCGQAGFSKIFQDVTFYTDANTISQATVLVGTNESGALTTFPITINLVNGWGYSAWGSTPWGDSVATIATKPIRFNMPLGFNTGELISVGFQHSVADEGYFLTFIHTTFWPGSEVAGKN